LRETSRRRAGSPCCPAVCGRLVAARGGFDDIAVVSVDRQDITVGRNGHAQRVVDGPIGCHILSREHGTLALERVRDCGDAVVQAIRDVGDHLTTSFT
jgi:hypothetical protein